MNKTLKIICIALALLLAIVILAVIICYFYVDTEDYLKSFSDVKGRYIIYDGKKYYRYEQEGTHYFTTPDFKGTKIGYCRANYGNKFDALMLNENNNIIISYVSKYDTRIWLEEDYFLPDLLTVEIDRIDVDKTDKNQTQRFCVWSAQVNNLTLNNVLNIEERLNLDKRLLSDEILYLHLASIEGLEFFLGINYYNSNFYLKFMDNKWQDYWYEVKEEYNEFFAQMIEC